MPFLSRKDTRSPLNANRSGISRIRIKVRGQGETVIRTRVSSFLRFAHLGGESDQGGRFRDLPKVSSRPGHIQDG